MNNEFFSELLESVKQGAAIMKGTIQPSRSFEFQETEVRDRQKAGGRLAPKPYGKLNKRKD